MTDLTLLQVLNAKLEVAKRFTKEQEQKVKEWIELYEAETPKAKTIDDLIERDQRYQYTAKVVFDNVERYRSSFFEVEPSVIYSKKGKDDELKAQKITAAWEYLKDKINFKQFMDDTYTYFGLCGFVSGHVGYKKEVETVVGEDGVEYIKYLFDDPFLEVYDHESEWFMPDSEFTSDARNVSYFRKKKMTKPEVLEAFGEMVEADESILSKDIDSEKKATKEELMRCSVYYYYGKLPKKALVEYIRSKNGEEIEETDSKSEEADESETKDIFYAVFTKNKILAVDKSPIGESTCALGRWYSSPKKFFGFGLGKLLEEQQRQESIRTGQLIRYADMYAFPKLAVDLSDSGTDPKQLMQRNNPVITFKKTPPNYINPPGANGVIQAMLAQNQQDIQTNAGVADISKMQKSQTLNTATGQTIIAESNEKRIKIAKDKYYEFLRQIIIKVFKYAQLEWQEEKVQIITDDEGNANEVSITSQDFADINFDTDIIIEFENAGVNKDVIRQQAIVMYDKMKNDPLSNRRELIKMVYRVGFGEKNPDQYIQESNLKPGMRFMGEDGLEYVVDDTGTLIPQENMDQLAPPSDGEMQPASDQAAIQGQALNVGI
jgi:hypothetical protein